MDVPRHALRRRNERYTNNCVGQIWWCGDFGRHLSWPGIPFNFHWEKSYCTTIQKHHTASCCSVFLFDNTLPPYNNITHVARINMHFLHANLYIMRWSFSTDMSHIENLRVMWITTNMECQNIPWTLQEFQCASNVSHWSCVLLTVTYVALNTPVCLGPLSLPVTICLFSETVSSKIVTPQMHAFWQWNETEHDHVIKAELTPKYYSLVNKPRLGRKKSGVIAVIFKSNLNLKVNTYVDVNWTSFECVETILSAGNDVFIMMCIYKPPPSKQNKLTPLIFHNEFEIFLHMYGNRPGKLAIFGDFNFHFDDTDHIDIKRISWCLESLNFQQNVSVPTHKCGHILDWVITRKDETFMNIVKVEDLQLSDHFVIFCLLNVTSFKRTVRK